MSLWLIILLLAIFLVLLFIGVPIVVSMGISSMMILLYTQGWRGFNSIPMSAFTTLTEFTLVSVTLFILMGQIIFASGMGRDLFTVAVHWLGRFQGGLAMASIAACAIFGAMCGVTVAGAATIGSVAVPEMKRYGYSSSLATGVVAAAGALAILIPPSITFILYGVIANVSIGKLFMSGILPGIMLSLMMMVYVFIAVKLKPGLAPPVSIQSTYREKFRATMKIWPATIIILAVVGGIYTGIFTPTEAAACGSLAAFIVAGAIYRSLNLQSLKQILFATTRTSCMILIIVTFAIVFGRVVTILGLPTAIVSFVTNYGLGKWEVVIGSMVLLVIGGCFVDAASLILITVPLLVPTLEALNIDMLWFGLLVTLNMEMAVITPPVGMNLYVIKGLFSDVPISDIIRGSLPFVIVEALALVVIMIFPEIGLWLPNIMK